MTDPDEWAEHWSDLDAYSAERARYDEDGSWSLRATRELHDTAPPLPHPRPRPAIYRAEGAECVDCRGPVTLNPDGQPNPRCRDCHYRALGGRRFIAEGVSCLDCGREVEIKPDGVPDAGKPNARCRDCHYAYMAAPLAPDPHGPACQCPTCEPPIAAVSASPSPLEALAPLIGNGPTAVAPEPAQSAAEWQARNVERIREARERLTRGPEVAP